MLRKISLFLIIVCIAVPLYAITGVSTTSPWEHSISELTTPVTITPGTSPLTYSAAFTREREMYGYNPRFMPTMVTFDKNNRPYMLTSIHPTNTPITHRSGYAASFTADTAYLQTLDDAGNWIVYDVGQMFWDLYDNNPYVDPQIATGFNYSDRVVFDDDNGLYFTYYEAHSLSGKTLVYSHDDLETVEKLGLNYIYLAVLESFDTFLSSERHLPTIINGRGDYTTPMSVVELQEDALSYLSLASTKDVSPGEAIYSPDHSGYLNHTVTIGDTVHCFWIDAVNQTVTDYTNQYYSSYNRTTGEVTAPYLLGSTFGNWYGNGTPPTATVDPHNGPTVTVDRNKVIHVVLGGHGSQAKYTYSEDKGRTWSVPENLPGGNLSNTYPTVITDRENTIHLVYRCTLPGADGNYKYKLSYSRKKAGESWVDMGALVVPGRLVGYSIYHQKLTVDRLGRLFLTYWYRALNLTASEITEYEAKWPSEPSPANDDWNSIPHDPVTIMSDNGGDTWRIATTQDFVDGIIDDTVPVAYYEFNSAGSSQPDSSGNDNDLDLVSGTPTSVGGVTGNAVSFDGVNDGYSGSFNQEQQLTDGAFTVAGWYKLSALPSSPGNVVHAKNGGNKGFALYVENDKWVAYTYADGVDESVISSSSVSVDQWVHVAFTYADDDANDVNGIYTGTLKLYVDGVMEATALNKSYSPVGTSDIAVAMSSLGGDYFACDVDDLAIFSGAMPQQKIAELANNEYTPFNVSRELLYEGDFNEDGTVDMDDAMIFFDKWLN